MNIAFITFNGMTLLDLIGVYDPLTRVKTMGFQSDIEWDTCGFTETIRDTAGIEIKPDKVKKSLSEYDMIVIPGGFGTRNLIDDRNFMDWIKTGKNCNLITSVCTGSLILGAAGFLKDKRATTHPSAFKELKKYCFEVVDERVIDEGNIITAGGITSSIDLGLYLCEKISSYEVKEKIRIQMDYMMK